MYRFFATLFLLLCSLTDLSAASGDTLESLLHYDGEPLKSDQQGGYYFRRAYNDGSRWHTKDYFIQTKRLYKHGIYMDDSFKVADGVTTIYHKNGKLRSKGRFVKGNKESLHKEYDSTGRLIDSAYYMHDLPHKVHYSWFKDGTISSKGIYDDSGRGAGYEWDYFEGGKLSSYGKKSEGHVNDSVWSYYHRTGNLSFKAWWDKGIFVKGECFDENGQSQGACDTTTSMPDPGFDVNSFIGRNLIMPNDVKYDAINHYNCEVIVEFCVLEDGSVEVWNPHSTCFKSTEKEAVRVLRKMPKWKPARQHNRPVKVYYTIPISFRLI